MTSEEERAVYKLLSDNNIGIYTGLIKKAEPMRQVAVTTPTFNNEDIRNTFFSADEEVKITVEFDSIDFRSDTKSVVIKGNTIFFECPQGTGSIPDFGRKAATDAAQKFISSVSFGYGTNIELEKISDCNGGYRIEYNEVFNNEKIFSSSRTVCVTKDGIVSAEAEFYIAEGYTGERRQICSCDEALLTVMYAVEALEGGVPPGAYIEKVEIGYNFQSGNDISEVSVLKLVPCYRVYVSPVDTPFVVNAYTNSLI